MTSPNPKSGCNPNTNQVMQRRVSIAEEAESIDNDSVSIYGYHRFSEEGSFFDEDVEDVMGEDHVDDDDDHTVHTARESANGSTLSNSTHKTRTSNKTSQSRARSRINSKDLKVMDRLLMRAQELNVRVQSKADEFATKRGEQIQKVLASNAWEAEGASKKGRKKKKKRIGV